MKIDDDKQLIKAYNEAYRKFLECDPDWASVGLVQDVMNDEEWQAYVSNLNWDTLNAAIKDMLYQHHAAVAHLWHEYMPLFFKRNQYRRPGSAAWSKSFISFSQRLAVLTTDMRNSKRLKSLYFLRRTYIINNHALLLTLDDVDDKTI